MKSNGLDNKAEKKIFGAKGIRREIHVSEKVQNEITT